MAITRAKATALLNQREMSLYDDSRANALRNLDEKALNARISRARDARNRARDLVQRQKLSSRDRTGNKRGTSGQANQRSKDKAELMADILSRFEAQLATAEKGSTGSGSKKTSAAAKRSTRKAARRTGRKATTAAKKTAGKKTTAKAAKKTATKKTATGTSSKTAAARQATRTSTATKKAATKKTTTTATKPAAKTSGKTGKKAAAKKSARKLTPKQALKRTQALLEEKKARDRAPKPWEAPPHGAGVEGQAGYQSNSAARSARRLHAAETRLPAIMGSVSTRDRINQGKRDRRRSGDDS